MGVIDVVGESGQYESKRVTGNEGWYSSFYKDNKKAPTVRDAYDIAYQEAMEEAQNSSDPEAKIEIEAEEAIDSAGTFPIQAEVYDLKVHGKGNTTETRPTTEADRLHQDSIPSTITIREMLSDVNDHKGFLLSIEMEALARY